MILKYINKVNASYFKQFLFIYIYITIYKYALISEIFVKYFFFTYLINIFIVV